MTSNSHVDSRVLHAGLPVLEGEKWGMNVWIRERAVPLPSPAPVTDSHSPAPVTDSHSPAPLTAGGDTSAG